MNVSEFYTTAARQQFLREFYNVREQVRFLDELHSAMDTPIRGQPGRYSKTSAEVAKELGKLNPAYYKRALDIIKETQAKCSADCRLDNPSAHLRSAIDACSQMPRNYEGPIPSREMCEQWAIQRCLSGCPRDVRTAMGVYIIGLKDDLNSKLRELLQSTTMTDLDKKFLKKLEEEKSAYVLSHAEQGVGTYLGTMAGIGTQLGTRRGTMIGTIRGLGTARPSRGLGQIGTFFKAGGRRRRRSTRRSRKRRTRRRTGKSRKRTKRSKRH